MNENEVTEALESTGALLNGHFLLSSGLHSDRYVQCALVLRHPDVAARVGEGIATLFKDSGANLVAGPAIGGIVIAHEVGRALGVPVLFAERENGKMTLRRGFSVGANDTVLAVEDVITTGGSVGEVAALLTESGARLAGIGCIVDRSEGKAALPMTPRGLLKLALNTYRPADCPMCRAGSRPVKPGSRSK